jgi:hypothetical protein
MQNPTHVGASQGAQKALRASAGVSRRHVMLNAVASVPAVVLSTPSIADPHPDAALLELGRRWVSARVAVDAAMRRAREIQAMVDAQTLPPPDALRYRDGDCQLGLKACGGKHLQGFIMSGLIEELRDRPETFDLRTYARPRREDAEFIERRRSEIITAYNKWSSLKDRVAEDLGLTVADETLEAACCESDALEREILETAASTLEGLAVLARVVHNQLSVDNCGEEPECEFELRLFRLASSVVRLAAAQTGAVPSVARA